MEQALPPGTRARRQRARWMGVLARVPAAELAGAAAAGLPADYVWLRRPETGLVMVRARAGGTGGLFNLGEMAVTRCALRLADGTVGQAYVAGRDALHAERAAVIDALLQQAAGRDGLQAALDTWIAPLESALAGRRADTAARAAGTRVEFFTVVRGEDAP